MPRGSKPGERRGGRQRATLNRRTVLTNRILAAAAAPSVPAPLIEQLAEGGRLVIPIGTREQQELHCIRKMDGRIEDLAMFACRFVPLVGRHAWPDVTRS